MKLILNLSFFALFLTSCGAQTQNESGAANTSNDPANQQICQRIDADQFRAGIAAGNVQILDIRTPDELREGKIDGAININFYDADFREQVAKLDRNIPVYVYCRSGGRSQKAMEVLKELGFSVVYELLGGYMNY
jgi:rhodanese-related sulfurtransferase